MINRILHLIWRVRGRCRSCGATLPPHRQHYCATCIALDLMMQETYLLNHSFGDGKAPRPPFLTDVSDKYGF